MSLRSILIATKNSHKTAEIRDILGGEWIVKDLNDYPDMVSPEETGVTFQENAAIKAVAASRLFEGYVLSDDSGLEVDVLNGAPGVYSARYAGIQSDDAANRNKLLLELLPYRNSICHARFRCSIAIAERGNVLATFDGTVEGRIIEQESGAGGFGYDALFVPDGYKETFAQLPASVKNQLSHRARAMEQVLQFFP